MRTTTEEDTSTGDVRQSCGRSLALPVNCPSRRHPKHLLSLNGHSRLHAYNRTGKIVATLPTERTPKLIRDAIQRLASELLPNSTR